MSQYLLEYPFASLLYPVHWPRVAHLGRWDACGAVGRERRIPAPQDPALRHLGAVAGRVLIYLHKERVLDHVQQRYPAAQYVMVDDNPTCWQR